MTTDTTSIGQRLKQWRTARGLSLGGVALRAGVHDSTLSRWESGKRQPSLPELEAVLEALGVGEDEYREALRTVDAPRAHYRLRRLEGTGAPVSGDLLRAMRVRQRWTQAETARAVGTTQAQIAKWEHSEAWPDAAGLHRLCWSLKASPEEVAALSRGRFRVGFPTDEPEEEPKSHYDWELKIDFALFRTRPDLIDLKFLSIETALWERRGRYSFAQPLLGMAYAHHARAHLYYMHPERAGVWADRALSMVQEARESRFLPPGWGGALIAAGAAAVAIGEPRGLRQAVKLMEAWLPALQPFHYRAWVLSDLSSYLARLGRADAALSASQTAIQETIQGQDEGEYMFRLRDHIRLLTNLGLFANALRALEKLDTLAKQTKYLAMNNGDSFVRHRLLEAECLLGVGSLAAASDALRLAQTRLHTDRLEHLTPLFNAVSSRF